MAPPVSNMTDATQTGPVLSADGTPLKRSLQKALFRQKMRALALIAPLLIFVLVTFILPIGDMLFRSVENQIVSATIPRTVVALETWDADSGESPGEEVYAAFYWDMAEAVEAKTHTRLGGRLNYEMTGLSSLFRKTGRGVSDIGEFYMDQLADLNDEWEEGAFLADALGAESWVSAATDAAANDVTAPAFVLRDGVADALPLTAHIYSRFAAQTLAEKDSPLEEDPWEAVYTALYQDLISNPNAASAVSPAAANLFTDAAAAVPNFENIGFKEQFIDIDKDWDDPEAWQTIQAYSSAYTAGYFLAAMDLMNTPDGIARVDEDERIYIRLFGRTIFMSLLITGTCILLGYPIAYLLSNLKVRHANLLMILVLLPFWTSLLVRTSAWKVLLQQQGVINDLLVWVGLVADDSRLQLINNQLGTVIAMTHILLPFMILPLFSVMKTIPPSYVRAAKSLGATNWTAFWRVYFPQSVPGIGAGSILVFILAIGYYITPELVGGTSGVFISNRIAYHISTSLNWGLAAALGAMLLVLVLALYWIYDKMVGIDNVKLG